jgi:hypothetical protein
MAQRSATYTFNYSDPALELLTGDIIEIRLRQIYTGTSNYTASLGAGSVSINSNALATGYNIINCAVGQFVSASAGNELTLSTTLSNLYGGQYQFVPNPLSGSATSSFYEQYGDVDYEFTLNPYDIILVYLSDGTYVEAKVLEIHKINNQTRITLNQTFSTFAISDINNNSYEKMLFLKRIDDETNIYLVFPKRSGQTSYGFLIPNDLSPDVLANIDTITKQVKQKILSDQSAPITIGDLTGGGF